MALELAERLAQVGNQILDVLDTDGQAHEAVRDADAQRSAGSTTACVIVTGCVISVSTEPRFSASVQSFTESMSFFPAFTPPWTSNHNIAPNRSPALASACCGKLLRPGY